MLLYVFLVLGTWKGVLGQDDICDLRMYEVCDVPLNIRFPGTEADLNGMCPQFIQYLNCKTNYLSKCGPEDDPDLKYFQDLKDTAAEVCQKDSQLHLRIVENIGCLKEVVQNEYKACENYAGEKVDPLAEQIEAEYKGQRERTPDEDTLFLFQCLITSIDDVCLITKSSARCGSDARDIALEIYGRNRLLERNCPDSIKRRNIEKHIGRLGLELEEEAILKRFLVKE